MNNPSAGDRTEFEAQGSSQRALIPVSYAGDPASAREGGSYRNRRAASPYLTQLSRQYESRGEAERRREETRQKAEDSYRSRPTPPSARHLVWA